MKQLLNYNTRMYRKALRTLLKNPCEKNSYGITHELLAFQMEFDAYSQIDGAFQKYIKNELDWYRSQDLCIKGHEGIESNKVWQKCATNDGHVNSNYGWCIYSSANSSQFEHAIESIKENPATKQAVMIYSRPSINREWNDNKHAKHDMVCTIYVSYLLRNGFLRAHVHMRSNDIWFGLRNDLAWQQYVLETAVMRLNTLGIQCRPGPIVWHADSLHIYDFEVDKAQKYLGRI